MFPFYKESLKRWLMGDIMLQSRPLLMIDVVLNMCTFLFSLVKGLHLQLYLIYVAFRSASELPSIIVFLDNYIYFFSFLS